MKTSKRISNADRATVFKELISKCPICNQAPDSHFIALLSSIVLDNNILKEDNLEKLISNKKWEDASKIKQGSQNADMRQYHLLKCPERGISLLRFKFTYELWSNDILESCQVLSTSDAIVLNTLMLDFWDLL